MIKIKRNRIFLIAVCTIALLLSVSFIRNFDNSIDTQEQFQLAMYQETVDIETETVPIAQPIIVDVKGAVEKPGVYEMKLGDRVVHAIEKANGFLQEANKNVINLALLLEDEMVIFVPITGEEEIQDLVPLISNKSSEKINVNVASNDELQKIPGIGPAKAAAIIKYREENGKFNSIGELTNVSGIGQKTVEKMTEFIEVK
ncbi:helix-hairpin-helix domain-containing protein [Anaerobacillus sp. CMMVII]|uniref:helix-hairpin-helix domain-containing protein n=1 Tax=Anaerobacillus sp. CMMVII TaxID=2755588 RepID=UPI0021B7EFBA|nr:helix-hairpin-helix domain-containing protein [Anaerobacillus sp. CMMVII]MCT8139654.1 helix-hairpin-helix domain-containing protein [Anaerobacillus sp. CMMVII]